MSVWNEASQGKVFYYNDKENLKIILEWSNSGWTSREAATADSNISGAKVRTLSSDIPWADILEVGNHSKCHGFHGFTSGEEEPRLLALHDTEEGG